jgi:4-coumarate--CoA ligase
MKHKYIKTRFKPPFTLETCLTMAPEIYNSQFPPVPVHYRSVFTHLFNTSNDVGGFSGVLPAYVDAPTGTTIARAQLKQLALSFGYGIQHHPNLGARRGDTLLIYSQNALAWPVVLFGAREPRIYILMCEKLNATSSVAAGLRCTFASHANELAHQYIDSGAKLILSNEEGVTAIQNMLKDRMSPSEVDQRIIVMTNGLEWAYGPTVPIRPELSDLLKIGDLLKLGTLKEEEKFDGRFAHETAYVCYTSGS